MGDANANADAGDRKCGVDSTAPPKHQQLTTTLCEDAYASTSHTNISTTTFPSTVIVTSRLAMATVGDEHHQAIKIKVMVNKRTRGIMYAEAGKDFVDMLLGVLTMPVGVLARLSLCAPKPNTARPSKPSCLENLYTSVQNLPPHLMKSDKSLLLDPQVFSSAYSNPMLGISSQCDGALASESGGGLVFYACRDSGNGLFVHNVSNKLGVVTCACGNVVDQEVRFVDGGGGVHQHRGFVKKSVSFLITDELRVVPLDSTATIMQLWNDLRIREPSELEERTVSVGVAEVMTLLRASVVSRTALNDVFNGPYKRSSGSGVSNADDERLALQGLLLSLLGENQTYYFGKNP